MVFWVCGHPSYLKSRKLGIKINDHPIYNPTLDSGHADLKRPHGVVIPSAGGGSNF